MKWTAAAAGLASTIGGTTLAVILVSSAGSAREETPFVYVSGSDGVSVFDAADNSVVATYQVGATEALAITRDGKWLFAGSAAADGLSDVLALDARTGALAATFSVSGTVSDLALSADESRLWVSHWRRCHSVEDCAGSNGFTIFDLASESVEATLQTMTSQVVFDPSGDIGYFVRAFSIAAVQTESFTIAAERPVICCLSGVVELHPNGHTVYALGNEFGGFIGIADFQQPMDFAKTSFVRGQGLAELDFQADLAFRFDGTRAYLPGSIGRAGALFVLDTSDPWTPTLERVIDLEARPGRIGLTRDGLRAYLVNDNGSVAVIELDSGKVVAIIAVASEAHQVVVGPGTVPASPSPIGAESGGGCHVTITEGRSRVSTLFLLLAAGFLWARRTGGSSNRAVAADA